MCGHQHNDCLLIVNRHLMTFCPEIDCESLVMRMRQPNGTLSYISEWKRLSMMLPGIYTAKTAEVTTDSNFLMDYTF